MKMKPTKLFLCLMSLFFITMASCSDDNDVYISDRKFVRIDQSQVYLTVGEKIKVSATVDEIAGETYTLNWSVLNPDIATAERLDGNMVSITAISAGSTIIKVETADGKLQYYADLTVTDGEQTVKILSIGSGTAYDATSSYLYDIARDAGISLVIGNMYIDNASLEDHVTNMTGNKAEYIYNRIAADGSVTVQNAQSLKNIIKSENWNYIVYEESPSLAGMTAGYQTQLPALISLVDEAATNPDVKYLLHQPWAYAKSADEDGFANYDRDQDKMYKAIIDAVNAAEKTEGIEFVIPSGTAIQNGRTSYIGESMLIDGIHLNVDAARFTTACTWYGAIFEKNGINYSPDNLINYDTRLAKEAAHKAVTAGNKVTVLEEFLDSPMRVYIDFGPQESPAPFNNYRFPTDPAMQNMRNDRGEPSGWDIVVDKAFTGVLERGLGNSLGFPNTASSDMFFCDGIYIPLSGFKVSGLTKGEKYTFTFYGHINDSGTQTEYRVIGKNNGVACLVNDYNPDRVAAIKGIEPDDDGNIYIEMRPGPDNTQWAKFYGVNVMVIMAEG